MATKRTDGYTADPKKALYIGGDSKRCVQAVCDIEAGDNDGDQFILVYNLPVDTLVSRICLPKVTASIANATDYDIGFYKPDREDNLAIGVVLDTDALVDGLNLTGGDVVRDILGENIGAFEQEKTIGELLDLTVETQPQGVHMVLTMNTAGTAAGELDMEIELVRAA